MNRSRGCVVVCSAVMMIMRAFVVGANARSDGLVAIVKIIAPLFTIFGSVTCQQTRAIRVLLLLIVIVVGHGKRTGESKLAPVYDGHSKRTRWMATALRSLRRVTFNFFEFGWPAQPSFLCDQIQRFLNVRSCL